MTSEILEKSLTGAEIFMETLRSEGVDTVFGYPGAIILSIYEEFFKSKDVKHYLVRHEQSAIHAAEGYARVSGKCGVALVTSGPGATNTITGLLNAYLDGYPLVVFTGQVSSNLIGTNAFQEADVTGLTKPCTKKNFLVRNVNQLEKTIKEAFFIANSGKKGPVVVDIPKDILEAKMCKNEPLACDFEYNAPKVDEEKIRKLAELLNSAKRPVIISGGGVLHSNGGRELTCLAKSLNIPVTMTMMGLGTYYEENNLNLGMLGVLGNFWANRAVSESDLIFAIGTRLNDRIAGSVKNGLDCGAKFVHVDIEKKSFMRTISADIEIEGDAKDVLQKLLSAVNLGKNYDFRNEWVSYISEIKQNRLIPEVLSEKMHAPSVLKHIYNFTKKYNPIVATEVGQHQVWAVQNFEFNCTRRFLTSGGLGTMGFGFPAAMGACLADKNALVLDISGDGSIQMSIQELATCVEYNLPVKVLILNNGYLGMVRQWQEKSYNGHYSGTKISSPDFVKVAQAYGAKGIRVVSEDEIDNALDEAIDYNGPVFVDFVVEDFDFAYPWVEKK